VKHWISVLRDESQLNERDNFGYAPLHYAAKFNRYNILVMLVEAGAGKI
jgi:ankyrin repeat protein